MKKTVIAIILLSFFFIQAGYAPAAKEDLQFSIQRVKTDIAKVQKKSEEIKTPIAELQKAQDFIKQAESELTKNKNWRGALNKDAEPLIIHLTEIAETYVSIASSRLGKMDQVNENARLEKQIPALEAKIKVFEDKNAEIKKLREELAKPQGKIRDVNSEITNLKKEKRELADQVSQLKSEKEKLSGKVETLNDMVASVRKDLSERIKEVENLSADNKILKQNLKSTEAQRGSNITEMQAKLNLSDSKLKLLGAFSKIGLISRLSSDEFTFMIPRSKLIKTGSRTPTLTADAELYISEITRELKHFPASKLSIKVHGFGKPANAEDNKSTTTMANLLKKGFIDKGLNESSVEASGAGSSAPIFSRTAIEENRRIEMTIRDLSSEK